MLSVGVKLAVVSNFDTRLRPLLSAMQLDSLFDAIVVSAVSSAFCCHCPPSPGVRSYTAWPSNVVEFDVVDIQLVLQIGGGR